MIKRLSHPFISELKRYVASQNKNLGPIVMSVGAAIGIADMNLHRAQEVLDKQHKLSEVTDMIHATHSFHRCLVDEEIPMIQHSRDDVQKLNSKALHQDNVMSLLLGDYLLAQSCVDVAEIRHTKTLGLVAAGLEDYTRGEYFKIELLEDGQSSEHTHKMIEKYAQLTCGSLLSNSCLSVSLLAGFEDDTPESQSINNMASTFGMRTGTAHRLIDLFCDQKLNIDCDKKLIQDLDRSYFVNLILDNLAQSERSLKPLADDEKKQTLLDIIKGMRSKVC